MEKYVLRNIPRPNKAITDEFAELGVATVYEAQGKIGLMDDGIKPILQNCSICGPAVTAICYAGDNLMIHAAIEVCQPGDVLVVTTIGQEKAGMIGELIVQSLIKRGVKGVVIDSGIRDVARIRALGFPVWTRSITPRGTTKIHGGWVNAEAVCGGVIVNPGDLIVADDDGVVVVKKQDIDFALAASRERKKKEELTSKRIQEGQLSVDFYGFREVLQKQKVVYYDNQEELPR